MHRIHDIESICSQNVQSLEKYFYLGAPSSFDHNFTHRWIIKDGTLGENVVKWLKILFNLSIMDKILNLYNGWKTRDERWKNEMNVQFQSTPRPSNFLGWFLYKNMVPISFVLKKLVPTFFFLWATWTTKWAQRTFPYIHFFCIRFLQLNIARKVHSRKPFGQEYGCWEKKH